MLVDSHCHLNYEGLAHDVDAVIERGRAAGIGTFLSINTKLREYDEIIALVDQYHDVFGTVGIHPHEAQAETGMGAADLIARTAHPRIIGLGETGLDYFYENAPRDHQIKSFKEHIAAARETGLPLVIHSRDAEADSFDILSAELEKGPFKAVIHCFTGSRNFMKQMVDLGFYISISGIVTFKKATDLQQTAKAIPDDRLLVETDAPFLAPVPYRGKICEPAYVADTARFLANLRGIELEDLARQTTANFFRLFSKATPPSGLAAQ
ncbi:TatD-related deoxyribonuclease [Iodidimonas nitroreducens]|uniref:TatD-related deoxyribonuclease n=1 Tax=Iodidimonas nitroreducens TaxID=1236968 RepID=A0A5A7N6E5_9PROT|nr:TatD family hydrolase [Iodidimonas nitroreducens]GAK32834.1 putative deoxyribonuclease [alpha proteobacterium Q-1]GER02980.1 TatD-related deoxyribonuclease [Iodidimonas nitroreducens]